MKRACIVLPTFNEAANVRVLIPEIFAHAAAAPGHEVHVVVVDDDGSPDGTRDVVRELPALHDCTSGFRCIGAEALRRCDFSFLATRGYAFQTSLLAAAAREVGG